MIVTEKCPVADCGGDVKFDLGPHVDTRETQVVEARCSRCNEPYTLRTNINRRLV